MENLFTPQLRLEYFLKIKDMSFAEFARSIGLKGSNRQKYVGSGDMAKCVIKKLDLVDKIEALGMNYDWYLTGDPEKKPNAVKTEITIKVPYIGDMNKLSVQEIIDLKNSLEDNSKKIKDYLKSLTQDTE